VITLLFQAAFWGSFLYWWTIDENWPIAAPEHSAIALCVFLTGFAVTQGMVSLSSRRKWELSGWQRFTVGLLFPGAVQAAAGRPVWGGALNFALLGTVFVAACYCNFLYAGYAVSNEHPASGGMLYGIEFFISLSLLWLPLYLLNVWEACCAPRGAKTRKRKVLLTLLLSVAFPGLGTAYVEKRRYWAYVIFSFVAVFFLGYLRFGTITFGIGTGSGLIISAFLCIFYAYMIMPFVSVIDWFFSCARGSAREKTE